MWFCRDDWLDLVGPGQCQSGYVDADGQKSKVCAKDSSL